MGQQHHVLILSTAGRSILPGKIAALADAKNLAETLDGEFLLRRIDETEPHRLPSLAKKVAALFRISRSCRKISFSCRNRFSSAARSSCRSGGGASISSSRRLSSQRRSVERPTPRSLAISLCVRPLTSTKRTASAANSFPNRRCGLPMKCSSFLQKSSPLSQGKSSRLSCRIWIGLGVHLNERWTLDGGTGRGWGAASDEKPGRAQEDCRGGACVWRLGSGGRASA